MAPTRSESAMQAEDHEIMAFDRPAGATYSYSPGGSVNATFFRPIGSHGRPNGLSESIGESPADNVDWDAAKLRS